MRPFVVVATIAIAVAASANASAAQAQARSAPPLALGYKGFNYVSYYNGAYEHADSLAAMVATGANAAALILEYGIDVQNSAVYADATYTDSLTALAATITEANGKGLTVMVRPLIDFLDPAKIGSYSVGDWRSFYNPTNAATFFASYKSMIVAVAQVAQANGAAIVCIGVELDQLTGPAYQSYWTDIIASVRAVFSGTLTYSAEWDDDVSPWQGQHGLAAGTGNLTTQVSFWSGLDYLGIDAYPAVSDAAHPVLANLIDGWTLTPTDSIVHAVTGNQSLIAYLVSVATATGLPLLLTELGYESASDAAQQPAGSSTNVYDPALQANLYAAFFDAWQQSGNNSLAGVFFWNWDPNAAEVGPGNGANFSPQGQPAQGVVTAAFGGRAVNLVLAGTHDFNGDGFSDIAWRDSGGNVALWLMEGARTSQSGGLGAVPAAWSLAATGDFDGDRERDMLWQDGSGDLAIWFMNGVQVRSTASLGTVPATWSIAETGDFNGDGMCDILWRDQSGDIAIWLMNGAQVSASATLGAVPAAWTVVGIGDFNGDGTIDILWRDNSGDMAIWFMNGLQIASSMSFGTVPAAWSIAATGDFDGDGTSDVLWRNTTSGDVALWFVKNGQLSSSADFGAVPAAWAIVEAGDFNEDGKSDILWRNTGSGAVALWFMNGGQVSSTASLGTLPATWTIDAANGE